MQNSSSAIVVANLPGQRRMLDIVRRALRSADRLSIAVSFFRYSGLGLVAEELSQFQARGGKLRLLVSTYMNVTQPEALKAILELPGVSSRLHLAHQQGGKSQGLHAKMYVIEDDPAECWVGSSNFTKGGLSSNIEANLRHVGASEVNEVQGLFEHLWAREDVRPLSHELIDVYAKTIRQSLIFPISLPPTVPVNERPAYRETIRPNQAQAEALDRLKDLRESGERRAAIVAAPGVGKTFLAAFDVLARGASSLLFLSNRLEHLTQAERTFRALFADSRSYGQAFGGQVDASADFVFATIASASNNTELTERPFDYLVVDEFHHASAPSYRALLAKLEYDFLLGLTATPERQDGHDVLALCDYNIAYEVRLVEAINRGWLLPFHYFGIADECVDYSLIPWRSGGFDPEHLENALMIEERVEVMLAHCRTRGFDGPKRVAVGFCAGVQHARYMANALNKRGIEARAVTGADSVGEREEIYEQLQDPSHPLEWLFVADVLNEGVDLPAINCVVFLRPTESATIFIQQLGRGLRLTPNTEVLTVLDFVGHHRAAWLAVEALSDRNAPRGPSTVPVLDITPPQGCEIILDARTTEILEKVRRHAPSRKDLCLATYKRLRQEFDIIRPQPVDLLSDSEMPTPSDVRTAFGSWIGLRQAAEDAQPWEHALSRDSAGHDLLISAEKDWQAQRVYPYAALWGMCARPDDPNEGYETFYRRFPRWRVEYKPYAESKVAETLKRKLGDLFDGVNLLEEARRGIPSDLLLEEIEGRIQYTLEKDFRLRHGGTLRRPGDLGLHRSYSRPEIVNYFGSQYDPARHNMGVMEFDCTGEHIVIITKLDTSSAIQRHNYTNYIEDEFHFVWTSQNRQARHSGTGYQIVENQRLGITLHLFVQPGSHSKAAYLGPVDCIAVKGDAPMEVKFRLRNRIPDKVIEQLRSNQRCD